MRGESQRQQKGYECSMEPSENSWPEARKRRMRGVSVSFTKVPAKSGSSSVKQQSASMGQTTGKPSARPSW